MDTEKIVSPAGPGDVDLPSGTQVGEYVLSDKIGEGGFGAVYRAEHPLIGKQAAIKVLNRQYSADPSMVSRFVAEARAVNQIRHRNIIDIFGFGQLADGRHYYVMELLNGDPLDQFIAARGRLALGDAVPILRAVARALDAAHAKGIAHRDLKPENVFLVFDADGGVDPKLLDFGIAKLLNQGQQPMFKTRTGAPIGTPYYMSPEQCRGRDVDHRTDIYAFGCVAYRMLTGAYPFDGDDTMEVLIKQIGEQPVPASQLAPELPASVDDCLSWMLRKDPAERPPNLVTAVRALEEAATSAGVQVAPDTNPRAMMAARSGSFVAPGTPPPGTPPPATASATSAALAHAATITPAAVAVSLPSASDPIGAVDPAGRIRPVASVSAPPGRNLVRRFCLFGVAAVGLAAVGIVYATRSTGEERPPDRARSAATARPDRAGAPARASVVEPQQLATERPAARAQASIAEPPEPAARPEPEPPLAAAQPFAEFEITGTPPGTRVYGPDGLIGEVPGPIQLPRGAEPVRLTFKAAGHRTTSRSVVPGAEGHLAVPMEALGSRSPRPRGPTRPDATRPADPDSLEDPFGGKR